MVRAALQQFMREETPDLGCWIYGALAWLEWVGLTTIQMCLFAKVSSAVWL